MFLRCLSSCDLNLSTEQEDTMRIYLGKYFKRGPNGYAKGTLCKFVHPKLCRASLVSGKCYRDRCYFYHVTGSARSSTAVCHQ